jgi:hypothetical protein
MCGTENKHVLCSGSVLLARVNGTKKMDVTIVVPSKAGAWLERKSSDSERGDNPLFVYVILPQSRLLWREILPCLMRSENKVFRGLVRALFKMLPQKQLLSFHPVDSIAENSRMSSYEVDRECLSPIYKRRLKRKSGTVTRPIFVWINPTNLNKFEYTFSELLNHWEKKLIKAQSMAGYCATLGGGFFMCNHWTTAVQLAKKQQILAALIGDKSMYYKCELNQAYNHVYAGNFNTAKQLIRNVYMSSLAQPHVDNVLVQMCYSAWLFCNRVFKAKLARDANTSKTVDDFLRIRLVQDRSCDEDLQSARSLLVS